MGRYSKSYSNYVAKKFHQKIEDGSIFERDWGTLGERHVIESGKRRIYSDSNFLFTDNTIPGTKYRNNTGEWSEPYTQDSLGSKVDNTVNDTSILSDSNDIRDYAYYGSAVELLRSTIENIIKWFPGRFWSTSYTIDRASNDGDKFIYLKKIVTDGHHNYAVTYTDKQSESKIHVLKNPFNIDFYHTNALLDKNDNALRNMPLSWKQYQINGAPLQSWDVWIKPYSDCDDNYTIKYDITFKYNPADCIDFKVFEEEDWCCVRFKDQSEVNNDECISFGCAGDCEPLEATGHIYGIVVNGNVIWCSDVENFVIQPEQLIIDNYFTNLSGFEAKILNKQNNPRYTTKFITPVPYKNNNPNYVYTEKSYTWPHDGYCLLVDTIGFENYFNALYSMASKMDELWCDNLWKNMTHESIKNFDWTYTKQYEEGQEVDNILGGTRMEEILRIWGRGYDDIKRYIDGISLKNCVTYDDTKNLGNAELSDKAELLGWEVYSTKLTNTDNEYLTNAFVNSLQKLENRWGDEAIVSQDKWYYSRTPSSVSQNMVDNNFMKKLILSSGEIFRTKGTRQAIEMVFGMFGIGDDDIEFTEKYYTVEPKNRDDLFCFYRPHPMPDDESEYTVIIGYDTLDEYINDNPVDISSPLKIKINDNFFDLVFNMTVGDFCEYMMSMKIAKQNYQDDEFSGTPIRDVYINNEHYIVPYFTQDQVYDGDVQFETKGGWGKMVDRYEDVELIKKQEFDYLETIPYMEVVQYVGDLLSINQYKIGEKKIYYVMNLTDLPSYVESIPTNISHLFKLNDTNNPSLFSSWKNIPADGVIDPEVELFNGVTDDDIKLADYCDKLMFDNIGNNPHCGYSTYDLGDEYLEYVKQPFKYPVEHYGFSYDEDLVAASQFKFNVTEHTGTRIVNLTHSNEIEYILPSKLFIIRNNIDNELYKNYLNQVVLKYVLQVIPSTTILVLENFK